MVSSSLVFLKVRANKEELLTEVPPPWLKVGTYVQYRCAISDVSFWSFEKAGAECSFRWECISLSDHIASLNFTLSGFFKNGTIVFEKHSIGYVDVDTRNLLYSNETIIGKTALWLPPYMKVGEKVAVYGRAPNETIAECFASGNFGAETCQGFQDGYGIRTVPHETSGGFDMDTGICQIGNLKCLEYLGFSEVHVIFELTATNVDLGPRYMRAEILWFLFTTLPITIPAISVTIIAVVLYRKRRKHKKKLQKTPLPPQQQPSDKNKINKVAGSPHSRSQSFMVQWGQSRHRPPCKIKTKLE